MMIIYSIKKALIWLAFSKHERILIIQSMMERIDSLRQKKINNRFWESLDNQEDIDNLFELKSKFYIKVKKPKSFYESYY